MGWHGPPGNCGCCPQEPPPPPCSCDDSSCLPPYGSNYSSIKIEVVLDDTFYARSSRRELFCNISTATYQGCFNVFVEYESEVEYSGLSAFNGTYEIPYYVLEDGVYVEGDPTTNPCGVWYYPRISATITRTTRTRRTITIADPYSFSSQARCAPSFDTGEVVESMTVFLETRNGQIYRDPDEYDASGCGGAFGPLDKYAYAFECEETETDASFSDPSTGDIFGYEFCSGISALTDFPRQLGITQWADGGETPISAHYSNHWADYPYGGPGIPRTSIECKASWREIAVNIEARNQTFTEGLTDVRCGFYLFGSGFVAGPYDRVTIERENTAFSGSFICILNQP